MSDWMGTYSTSECLSAGVDLEMPGPTKWRGKKLLRAVQDGVVSESIVSTSARRVLSLAKSLGLFEHPEELPEKEVEDEQRDSFICDAAAEGIVLLKNQGEVLPFKHRAKVALIGDLARVVSLGGGGSARVDALHAVSVIEGFNKLHVHHTYEPGVPVFGALPHADSASISYPPPVPLMHDSLPEVSASGKNIKLEWFNGSTIGANIAVAEDIKQPEYMIKEAWPKYLDATYCTRMSFVITPRTSGNHIFSVICTGKSICYIDGKVAFIREQETDLKFESFYFFKSKLERRFTFDMIAGQSYLLVLDSWATDPDVLNSPPLYGMMHQGASLRFFEYVNVPLRIASAAALAAASDYAVVCVGNTNEIESEGYDRDTMDLTADQYALISAVADSNSQTIVVNFSGAPVTMTQFVDKVPAILQAWFPGQECGHAVTRILTGIVNPSGRLPLSWPRQLEDNPSFKNFPAGEDDILRYEEGLDIGYRYYDRDGSPRPLFPFGFGLSYTSFQITEAHAPKSSVALSEILEGRVEVCCEVTNIGWRYGRAVVQFYVQLPKISMSITRPRKELKAFHKASLNPGETRPIKITLDKYSVSFYDASNSCWRIQGGDYVVHVGLSADDIAAQVPFCISQDHIWTGI